MVRGLYRRYPFVFAYSLALLASTLVEIGVQEADKSVRDMYYWIDEVVLDALVFCVVIAFIDEAARYSKKKVIERHWLVLGAAFLTALSFIRHPASRLNLQMTLVSRDLNICAVILDLILWSLLITARRHDRTLLLLSGGLGLQITGAIMGESLISLIQLSHAFYWTGTLLQVSTEVLGLYIWWRALRAAHVAQNAPA